VNRLEGGGQLFEGLSKICSSCQLFVAQRFEGLTTGTVKPSQLTTCVLASVLIRVNGKEVHDHNEAAYDPPY